MLITISDLLSHFALPVFIIVLNYKNPEEDVIVLNNLNNSLNSENSLEIFLPGFTLFEPFYVDHSTMITKHQHNY